MYLFIKRLADIFVSGMLLLLLLPFACVIIPALRFTGEGEIWYLQERMGLNNQLFHIYKFATMLKNSMNMGTKTITVRNDPRITPVGKMLRFTKMNELPQILNVFLGDMSFVGPRPLLTTSFAKYTQDVQEIVYKSRPGITGLGSLVFRDEEKLVSEYTKSGRDGMEYYRQYIYPYKGALEKWYYHNRSLSVDFKILILTALSLLKSDSDLVFSWLKGIPVRPVELTVPGIHLILEKFEENKSS